MAVKLTEDQKRIRRELRTQGWALVDTTKYLCRTTKSSKRYVYSVYRDGSVFGGSHKYGEGIPDKFEGYNRFIKNIIKKCLHDEDLGKFQQEFRFHNKGKSNVGIWHFDGGAIRVISSVQGKSTEFRPSNQSRKVLTIPLGWTLFFTAKLRRAKKIKTPPQTRHRMPAYDGVRKLIVSTFSSTSPKLWR